MSGTRTPVCFRRQSAGFTAIELIVSITIVAILLGIGTPSLRDTIVSQRVRSAANDLYSDFAYARAEAIKRNAQVRVVRNASSWAEGWTVMAAGSALRAQPRLEGVRYDGSPIATVIYNPDGRATLATTTLFNFSAAGGVAVVMRCVQITPSGRPAVRADGNRNGNCQDG